MASDAMIGNLLRSRASVEVYGACTKLNQPDEPRQGRKRGARYSHIGPPHWWVSNEEFAPRIPSISIGIPLPDSLDLPYPLLKSRYVWWSKHTPRVAASPVSTSGFPTFGVIFRRPSPLSNCNWIICRFNVGWTLISGGDNLKFSTLDSALGSSPSICTNLPLEPQSRSH